MTAGSSSFKLASNRLTILIYSTILIISCKCFRMPICHHRKYAINRLASENYANDNEIEVQTIRDDIKDIIKMFVTAAGGISSVSPAILMENAHILTKGRLYEYVMEKTIEECDNKKDISKIEAVDAFMKGFIVSERKQRSRLKMNYMMAGASSNRLDDAIALLSERLVCNYIYKYRICVCIYTCMYCMYIYMNVYAYVYI
jgi:hypothetical protein